MKTASNQIHIHSATFEVAPDLAYELGPGVSPFSAYGVSLDVLVYHLVGVHVGTVARKKEKAYPSSVVVQPLSDSPDAVHGFVRRKVPLAQIPPDRRQRHPDAELAPNHRPDRLAMPLNEALAATDGESMRMAVLREFKEWLWYNNITLDVFLSVGTPSDSAEGKERQGKVTMKDAAVVIDPPQVTGDVKPLHDVCNGPICLRGFHDFAPYYKELGLRYVCLHDVPFTWDNAQDIHYVFHDMEAKHSFHERVVAVVAYVAQAFEPKQEVDDEKQHNDGGVERRRSS
jgi:hypothetical protein